MRLVLSTRLLVCSWGSSSAGAILQLLPGPGSIRDAFSSEDPCVWGGGYLGHTLPWVTLRFKVGYRTGAPLRQFPVSCGAGQPPAL